MEGFIEKIVSKKKDIKDNLITAGIISLALIAVMMAMTYFPAAGIFIIAIIAYVSYLLITARSLEYEYIVTNGDLDIDKIIAKRRRKRLFSASSTDFEMVARLNSDKYDADKRKIKKSIKAVSSMDSDSIYFAVLIYKGMRTIVFFEPDDRMLNSFKAFIPKKVFE